MATAATAPVFPPPRLVSLAEQVFELLKRRGEKVCVVETACGGLISSTLLSQSGASAIFAGSQVLYTLPSRIALADWTPAHIAQYAGPTPALVEGLCASLRTRLTTDPFAGTGTEIDATRRRTEDASKLWALGESGTAGPKRSGDGRNRTPGYVALAVLGPGGTSASLDVDTGSADRAQNMLEFAVHALQLLLRSVRELDDREGGANGGAGRL